MLILKKHLSRRTVLRGMGASVGLPFLSAMVPAGVALSKTAAAAKPRMAFIYFPHGAVMDKWTPKTEGALGELPAFTSVAGSPSVMAGVVNGKILMTGVTVEPQVEVELYGG